MISGVVICIGIIVSGAGRRDRLGGELVLPVIRVIRRGQHSVGVVLVDGYLGQPVAVVVEGVAGPLPLPAAVIGIIFLAGQLAEVPGSITL